MSRSITHNDPNGSFDIGNPNKLAYIMLGILWVRLYGPFQFHVMGYHYGILGQIGFFIVLIPFGMQLVKYMEKGERE